MVLRLLRRLVDDGQTVVMVTHDAGAAALADRVVFLRDGEIAREVDGRRPRARRRRPARRRADGGARGPAMSGRAAAGAARASALAHRAQRALAAGAAAARRCSPPAAIVLGVGMVFGVLLLVGTIHSTFGSLYDSIYGRTDVVVSGEQSIGSLPEPTIERVRAVRGVERPPAGSVSVFRTVDARRRRSARPQLDAGLRRRRRLRPARHDRRQAGRRPRPDRRPRRDRARARLGRQHGVGVGDRLRAVHAHRPGRAARVRAVRASRAGSTSAATARRRCRWPTRARSWTSRTCGTRST